MVDPQQHFVLESVHMALEDAGISKEKIAGSETGIYIGMLALPFERHRQIRENKVII